MFQDLLFCFSNIIDAELYGRAVNFPTSWCLSLRILRFSLRISAITDDRFANMVDAMFQNLLFNL
jgi:hypothetical protein